MTQAELMELAVDKAIYECSWKSIEFLFRPVTVLDLLLRLDFDGMRTKIHEWINDDSPGATPFRFRDGPTLMMRRAIEIEEFYQKLKEAHEELLAMAGREHRRIEL